MKRLSKFLHAQSIYYDIALSEVKSGKKCSHWIWFVLPQLKGLGHSKTSEYYGLTREEAELYYQHPVLGKRLIDIFEAYLSTNKKACDVFGDDTCKVRSCAKLFYSVSHNPIFKKVIDFNNWL